MVCANFNENKIKWRAMLGFTNWSNIEVCHPKLRKISRNLLNSVIEESRQLKLEAALAILQVHTKLRRVPE